MRVTVLLTQHGCNQKKDITKTLNPCSYNSIKLFKGLLCLLASFLWEIMIMIMIMIGHVRYLYYEACFPCFDYY